VLLVLLVLQLLMRLALVDILLVLAPVAAAVDPAQTQAWASLWAQRFVGTVFVRFAQMLALSLGLDLVTKLPTNGAAALLQPLLGIAILAVGLKISGLMGGAARDSSRLDTPYLTWSRLYGEVAFSGWVVGVAASGARQSRERPAERFKATNPCAGLRWKSARTRRRTLPGQVSGISGLPAGPRARRQRTRREQNGPLSARARRRTDMSSAGRHSGAFHSAGVSACAKRKSCWVPTLGTRICRGRFGRRRRSTERR
jgi:hypothetical protein